MNATRTAEAAAARDRHRLPRLGLSLRVEPEAVAEVERLHAEVVEVEDQLDRNLAGPLLRRRASRARASERSLLERLGFDSYIDFRIRVSAADPAAPDEPPAQSQKTQKQKGSDVNDWFPEQTPAAVSEPVPAPEPRPAPEADPEPTLEILLAQANAFVAAQVRAAEAEAGRIVEAARTEATAMLDHAERVRDENEAARSTTEHMARRLASLESHLDDLAAIVEAVPEQLRTLRRELARAAESLAGTDRDHTVAMLYDVEREVHAAV
jgi:hypothetical protein